MSKSVMKIRLGFEVGTGEPVDIPLAHTFVTGQTQVSGKTTTLQAIVARSGRRALAFVTKRGEQLEGRTVRPYLPREGDQAIHWRFVETIMASALGQRALKYERLQIINAAKDARSLDDVRRNITRLLAKAKSGSPAAGIYELLGEYLDLVLPEMRALNASHDLDLRPGLNVMDLVDASPEMQALAIGAAIGQINEAEKEVLTVFPEAWQFAPRDRNTAAKFSAEKTARMGSVIGNYLLCDSQDIVGVSPVVRQASTVWIVGVQGEANELKRTLEVIKSKGIAAPKPSAIATLEIGQFFACYGRHAIKTYVRPAWMSDDEARSIALGGERQSERPSVVLRSPAPSPPHTEIASKPPSAAEPETTRTEEDMPDMTETNQLLRRLLTQQERPSATPAPATGPIDEEAMYQRFKKRLVADAPSLLVILADAPELRVKTEKRTIETDGTKLPGRIALLIKRGWLDEVRTNAEIVKELGRTGGTTIAPRVSEALGKLKLMGFVTDEADGWTAAKGVKSSISETK